MNEVSIIGCGETASQWDGKGISIGVNDCWRFGKPTDYLVVVNTKKQFNQDRLDWILRSQPSILFTHSSEWLEHFPEVTFLDSDDRVLEQRHKSNPNVNFIRFRPWRRAMNHHRNPKGNPDNAVNPNCVYFSNTSPFVAISLAAYMGAKLIKLYGVDFNNHSVYHPGNGNEFTHEIEAYKHLFGQLRNRGITITTTKESYLNYIL